MTTDIIRVFKNGKVVVRRGIVTATVDPRKIGMRRWNIKVLPPGRFKPRIGLVGYRSYFGPFEAYGKVNQKAITEQDAFAIVDGGNVEEKLAQAAKMLDWHFNEDKANREGES